MQLLLLDELPIVDPLPCARASEPAPTMRAAVILAIPISLFMSSPPVLAERAKDFVSTDG